MKALSEIIPALEGVEVANADDAQLDSLAISSLCFRSDQVEKGSLFFCVTGGTSDGHEHAVDAADRGAVALVVERPLPQIDLPQLVVPEVRQVMGPVADLFHDRPTEALQVYGVTGTNGKTTTSSLLYSMLAAAGRVPALVGTLGARIGATGSDPVDLGFTTPEAPQLQQLFRQMVDAGNDSVAIEVSSHALQQGRARGTRFDVVGFTNLTRDHLDFHRGFEAYYMAKRKLFVDRGPEGQVFPAAVNVDDDWGRRLFDDLVHTDREDVPVWGYTMHDIAQASVSARYLLTQGGASITIESPVGEFSVDSPLRGRFNVENVLCAATMALLGGLDPEHVQAGVESFEGVPGRFQSISEGQPYGVVVDYAHTPDSLENVLRSARDFCDRNLIVVFGCGGDRDRSKRPLMGGVAGELADVAIVTSDNPRSENPDAIIREIRQGMRGASAEVLVEPDRRAAIVSAIDQAREGDVVVIAGKGHEQGQVVGDSVIPFDDATVAREALGSAKV